MNSKQVLFVIQVYLFLSFTLALQFFGNESTEVTVRQIPAFPDVPNIQEGRNNLVVGGFDAPSLTFRRLAHLIIGVKSTNKPRTCTATVLYRRWLITAAHCFPRTDEISFPNSYAFVGEARTKIQVEHNNVKPYFIDLVLVHKGFKPEQLDARNDIALVLLNRRIPLDRFRRVNLASGGPNDPQPGEKMRVAGYGFINTRGPRPIVLKETEIEIGLFRTCKAVTSPVWRYFLRHGAQICAKSPKNDPKLKGPCFGDSGGPLFRVTSGGITQFGITSFANTKECARPDTVSYYTRISSQREAIKNAVNGRRGQWTIFRKPKSV